MSDEKRVMLTGDALDMFGQLTSIYIDALQGIAAADGKGRHMKVLVVAIPIDDDIPSDSEDNQLTQMQVMSNLDHEEVPSVLKQVTKTVETATAKGVTKRTVVFVPPAGGLPN